MKRILTFCLVGLLMSIAGSQSVTKAALHSVIGGTSAPASTLGPYTVTPFAEDSREIFQECSFVESPLGGNVLFSLPLEHRRVPGWITWSHGYSGDVYRVSEKTSGVFYVTLTMPENTTAFYFYAQPEQATEYYTIDAMAYDGDQYDVTISQEVNGNSGACYYGFYATEGSTIYNINIYSHTTAFAIGEFGISAAVPVTVPVPGAFILSNIGLCTLIKLRKHRFFKQVS